MQNIFIFVSFGSLDEKKKRLNRTFYLRRLKSEMEMMRKEKKKQKKGRNEYDV